MQSIISSLKVICQGTETLNIKITVGRTKEPHEISQMEQF